MKNVYFVQVGFGFGSAVYLPYAAGALIAAASADPEIRGEYAFPDIIFRRGQLHEALDKIKDPFLVGFSCCVWNTEYNKALAKLIKEKYPSCVIVFGGHNATKRAELMEDYVDFLLLGEGEENFPALLKTLENGAFETVPGLIYRSGTEIKVNEPFSPADLSALPSPYLTGIFDRLMEENRGVEWLAVLETNRGCPYVCAYCDWCAKEKVRLFPEEKVLAEIKWLSDKKIGYCFCADSNFGMFPRDVDFARALVEAKRRNGYPAVFRPCYAKHSEDRVFEISTLLDSSGMDKGATMAYQTLSPEALKNIGRENLSHEHFSSLLRRYAEAGTPTYSELILGLPGETKESFCRGICTMLDDGQHNSLSVYYCEMLPNAPMSDPDYIKKHGIETLSVPFNHIHSAPGKNEKIQEYSKLVHTTNTMPEKDWIYVNLFSVTVQCFHALGILRCFSLYSRYEMGIEYYGFFTSLTDYLIHSKGHLGGIYRKILDRYSHPTEGSWNYYNPIFGDVTWFYEEGLYLESVYNCEETVKELTPFLKSLGIPEDIFDDLMKFQRAYIRKPGNDTVTLGLSHDIPGFVNAAIKGNPSPLSKKAVTVRITPSLSFGSFEEYARETVWYGRRKGLAVYKEKEIITGDN